MKQRRCITAGLLAASLLASSCSKPSTGHGDYVLDFPGGASLDHGLFWPEQPLANEFFWEVWLKPSVQEKEQLGYVISDGSGQFHTLLMGFRYFADQDHTCLPTGNTWDGKQIRSFAGDDGIAAGTWAHYALGWDGSRLVVYLDGVPVGKRDFSGPRVEIGTTGLGGILYIGGSSHLNFTGRVSQVRGFDSANPIYDTANPVISAFKPQTHFTQRYDTPARVSTADFLVDYTTRADRIRDLGAGAYGRHHDERPSTYPKPTWVEDTTHPGHRRAAGKTPPGFPQISAAVPENALVFDSFSRPNSTLAYDNTPSLRKTEGGSLGPLQWKVSSGDRGRINWGIYNGLAVYLGSVGAIAYVDTGTSDQDIRVNRRQGKAGDGLTGITFRARDGNHHLFADAEGSSPSALSIRIGYFDGRSSTIIDSFRCPPRWTTLRVVAKGDTIMVYCDSTPIGTVQSAMYQSATGAGLSMRTVVSGLARFDNFSVFDAQ